MPAASAAARSRPSDGSDVAMLTAVGRPCTASSAKLGPDSMANGRPGSTSASTSGISRPVVASMPLAQITTGVLPGRSAATIAHRLRRTGQQQRVAGVERGERGGDLDAGLEDLARQIDRVGALLRTIDAEIAGSRDHSVTRAVGAARQAGERRAPGAAADHADMARCRSQAEIEGDRDALRRCRGRAAPGAAARPETSPVGRPWAAPSRWRRPTGRPAWRRRDAAHTSPAPGPRGSMNSSSPPSDGSAAMPPSST